MKLFLNKKTQNFRALGTPPQTSKQPPLIVNFWLRACLVLKHHVDKTHWGLEAFNLGQMLILLQKTQLEIRLKKLKNWVIQTLFNFIKAIRFFFRKKRTCNYSYD